ncbi:MAG: hypothetical protein FJ096_04290 [Deltaproteobacteria bacterium]|nr:hypothetical protein [Deltaproteobacteria bacterium]
MRRSNVTCRLRFAVAVLALGSAACSTGLVAGTRSAADVRIGEAKACLEVPDAERGACFTNLTAFDTLEDSAHECRYRASVVVHPARFMGSAEGLAVVTDRPRDVVPAADLRKDGAQAMLRTLSNGSYTRGCFLPGIAAVRWWNDTDRKRPPLPPPTPERRAAEVRAIAAKAVAELEEVTRDERAAFTETVRKEAEARSAAREARSRAVRERLGGVLRACADGAQLTDPRCDTLEELSEGERTSCRSACAEVGLAARVRAASNDCKTTWLSTSTQCEGLLGDALTRCTSACVSSARADREATFRFAEDACVELPKGSTARCTPSHTGTGYEAKLLAEETLACLARCKGRRGEPARPTTPARPPLRGPTTRKPTSR